MLEHYVRKIQTFTYYENYFCPISDSLFFLFLSNLCFPRLLRAFGWFSFKVRNT